MEAFEIRALVFTTKIHDYFSFTIKFTNYNDLRNSSQANYDS